MRQLVCGVRMSCCMMNGGGDVLFSGILFSGGVFCSAVEYSQ